uniref:Cyclopropane-fatty-acyl-phospholipid synthase n=1 Tax=uncultured bacterium TB310_p TaxID=1552140 RepID=A0A0K0LBK7_9BACT|nr:cyclopropane-fatty-acyl-phospholipid synthase [uncultured bacterium TB310_p]
MNTHSTPRGQHLVSADKGVASRARFSGWLSKGGAALFHKLIDKIDAGLEFGAIEGLLPDGTTRLVGGRGPGPIGEITIHSWNTFVRLARSGSVGFYKAWEAGEWSSKDPVVIFDLFMRNATTLGSTARSHGIWRLAKRFLHRLRGNSKKQARRNIAFHYDLGNDFYASWLDETMVYSSAMFEQPYQASEPLEAAQIRKIDHLLDRLHLRPGQALLEIGCGWGGLGHRARSRHDVNYTGITLSDEQAIWARDWLKRDGLDQGSRIDLIDYRDVAGQFDAIASVEMVEAVGQQYWPIYLETIAARLKPGGRAALQYIAINDALFPAYEEGVDFIQTYIFPGGMLLSETRFRALAEENGLRWADQVNFGLDYAETLKRWRRRFDTAIEAGNLPPGFDEKFVRLWRYYLMYCEGGFRGGGIHVAQVTLVKE